MKVLKWTYAAALVLLLHACSGGSYEGSSTDLLGQTGDPVPVRVSIGDPSGGIVSAQASAMKGSGPVDNMAQMNGKDVYVYAFNSDMFTSYAEIACEDNINTLVDGSLDLSGSKAGKKARIRNGSVYLDWVDSKQDPYYHSGSMSQIPYEFYAYYLDDLKISESDIVRTDDAVKISVTIDGRRDLMSSKAQLLEEQLKHCPEVERPYARTYSFSYYTGIRNILPTFYFKHNLARLEFELVPARVGAKKNVVVASIKVNSKYKADFVVAEKSHPSQLGLRFKNGYKYFTLTEKDGSQIPVDRYVLQTLEADEAAPASIKMGDCLLVAPQNEPLEALVRIVETDEKGQFIADVENSVMISYDYDGNSNMFAAGNKYKVKFQIYGATKVVPSVSLEQWNYGGSLDVDTEDDKPNI